MRENQDSLVETGRDRTAMVADAGLPRVSLLSILAGTLVAYGAFAILLAIVGSIASAVGSTIDFGGNWRALGVVGGIVTALSLLLSYLFGGYVAGRMARRAGLLHGLGVLLLGVLIIAAVAGLVSLLADDAADRLSGNLRNLGVPTTATEWRDIGTVAGIGSLVAMLLGSVLGGILGERWHSKLMQRALDPSVGRAARLRQQGERNLSEADDRQAEARLRAERHAAITQREDDGAHREGAGMDTQHIDLERTTVQHQSIVSQPVERVNITRQQIGPNDPDATRVETVVEDDLSRSSSSGRVSAFDDEGSLPDGRLRDGR